MDQKKAPEKTAPITLVSPDGKREWTSSDPVELTNTRAKGWREKSAPKPANKADTKSDSK
ncbi:hypothetical protein AB0K08_13550 [Citricoccus sp. NPDC055426]|uniref:hypothetical protein n=1 Tax=Citricoccus sp. NPDC055426 TaxID=3155536 RepID=UPI00343EED0F